MKLYELADELGLSSPDAVELCSRAGVDATWAGAELDDEAAGRVRAAATDFVPAGGGSERTPGATGLAPATDDAVIVPPAPGLIAEPTIDPDTIAGRASAASAEPEHIAPRQGPGGLPQLHTYDEQSHTPAHRAGRQRDPLSKQAWHNAVACVAFGIAAVACHERFRAFAFGFAVVCAAFAARSLLFGLRSHGSIERSENRRKGHVVSAVSEVVAALAVVGVVLVLAGTVTPTLPEWLRERVDRVTATRVLRGYPTNITELPEEVCFQASLTDLQPNTDVIVQGTHCDQPHIGEVFKIHRFSERAYPSPARQDATARGYCTDQLAAYTGGVGADGVVWAVYPAQHYWDNGDREVTCVIVFPAPRTTSIQK